MLQAMLQTFRTNYIECFAMFLFAVGFFTMMLDRNLVKKIIGMDIMDSAVYLLLGAMGYIRGRKAPIIVDGITSTSAYIDPLPAGLVLTGIVVSVSVSALMMALCVRLYQRYHTLNVDEIYLRARRGEEDENW